MQSVSGRYVYYSLMKVPIICKLSMPVYIDRSNMLGSRSCSLYIFMIISLELPIQTQIHGFNLYLLMVNDSKCFLSAYLLSVCFL